MPARHVVVDGSNIATEGRSLPSLVQLDVAVREYRREFPEDVITVVVDATFGHRIDASERADFDEAVAHNEIVSPPAGAIGRGDAFLLRVAEKVGATVLSNDSFQEFHGEHEWLFNNGRLIGGKPVPGVGWIFTPRTPVRGPKSRDSMRDARRAKVGPKDEIKKVQKAIAVAIEEAVEPDSPKVKRRRRSRGGSPPAEPVNDPLPFIEFVAAHPLGSPVDAEVESFSSHGAFVTAGGLRCYIPLTGLGEPPPRAAKEVLKRGETRQFVLQALDPPRRGIELALAEFAHVSGAPTAETVEEEIREAARKPSKRRRSRGADAAAEERVVVVPTEVVVAIGEATAEAAAPAEPKVKTRRGGRGRKAAAATPLDVEADGERTEEPVAAGGRGRGRGGSKGATTPDGVEPEVERTEEPVAAGGRGRGRGGSKRAATGARAPEPAAAEQLASPTVSGPAAAGPRKRPARPRAGAPRSEPAQAPVPLAPVEVAAASGGAPGGAVPAPSARKRAPRKAAATPPEPAAPLAPARPARKRAAAAAASAELAVTDPVPAPAKRAASAPVAAGTAVAAPPARRAAKRAVAAVADVATPAAEEATAPAAKTASRKAAAKKAPATVVDDNSPTATKAAPRKVPAKKSAAKKSAAKKLV